MEAQQQNGFAKRDRAEVHFQNALPRGGGVYGLPRTPSTSGVVDDDLEVVDPVKPQRW